MISDTKAFNFMYKVMLFIPFAVYQSYLVLF